MSFWERIRSSRDYDLARLVDQRVLTAHRSDADRVHVICDIDKTYLETEFDSLLDLAKVAMQNAQDKVTVPGAAMTLSAVRWSRADAAASAGSTRRDPLPGPGPALHFVSSSPPQLRKVLERKLAMDGLDWTSDTFKDQAYNIRMRRMDQLKQHVAYKSAAILEIIRRFGPPDPARKPAGDSTPPGSGGRARFIMIGDSAESDAYIYVGVALLVSGAISVAGYAKYLEHAGIEPQVARDVCSLADGLPPVAIDGILIRMIPEYGFVERPMLTNCISIFHNWAEAAAFLAVAGVITAGGFQATLRHMHNAHDLPVQEARSLLEAYETSLDGARRTSLGGVLRSLIARWSGPGGIWAQARTTGNASRTARSFRQTALPENEWGRGAEDRLLSEAAAWAGALHEARLQRKTRSKTGTQSQGG